MDCITDYITSLTGHLVEYVKQYPYVDDEGIFVPVYEYAPEGTASNYRMIISKELFVEAYNKWIKNSQ